MGGRESSGLITRPFISYMGGGVKGFLPESNVGLEGLRWDCDL
jgi:hypothetical protein